MATPTPDPIRRRVLIVLGVCAGLLLYHLIADRVTPFTNQAYVQTFIVDIAPEVAGAVVEVAVRDNQRVKAGDKLFRVDPVRFELAAQRAEAALAQAGQTIGASTSQIASAQARLTGAEKTLEITRQQSSRTIELAAKGVMSQAAKDAAVNNLQKAESEAARARADLDAARKQLGSRGADNPQIRSAAADLARAQLDLARSTVVAPSDGIITNLKLTAGQYVAAGAPVLTFIDTRTGWVIAEVTEKSISNVRPGNRAAVALASMPGRVYDMKVESIGFGVAQANRGSDGLPTISEQKGWVRPQQRFPVLLTPAEEVPLENIRVGALASAVIYTGNNFVMNPIAALVLRVTSLLGYVY
jgi:multidrug resistance efflux pump